MPITEQAAAIRRAQQMYRRVLVGWASDALRLRAAGLDRPSHRTGAGAVTPGRARHVTPGNWRLVA